MLNHKEILDQRKKYIGPSLSISYDVPLHIVRGEAQYLFDVKGNRYLDCVNNIQHVGHCHPKIVEAAQSQYKKLNTNTRYLDEAIVNYARNLTQTLPDGLDVCFFTNSGSEANDLAMRIARNYEQSKETIVLDGAYHGNLSSLIEISPYKHNGPGGSGTPDHVHVIPMPDPFRGQYRGERCAEQYAKEVQEAIDRIQWRNRNSFAFISEALMGCGGQLILLEGFLQKAFELVKKTGGLFIADEVQIGFGRMGSHFWGFDSESVVPDIVTMGKSMGNGHPLSAVVTTKEIADTFNNGMEYFNSFGGNPVSCAVGNAVLEVIKEEKLQNHANQVGKYFLYKLQKIKKIFPQYISEVRGKGLFIGIDLIKNGNNLLPNKYLALDLVNNLRNRGILLSVDGPHHNVIKIKPPLPFNKSDVDFVCYEISDYLLHK